MAIKIALDYFKIGFEHVIPLGYDHIMFIIVLFFFSSSLKIAITQCSIFTIAHSLTLALVAVGFININSQVVEIIISTSILIMALENIFKPQLNMLRYMLVFFFGLIHGMGFASALSEIGIPKNEFYTALFSFNLGVEAAQVTVIFFCYVTIAKWFKEKKMYQNKIVNPISITIANFALFITINRIFK
jgi:hypothetical protein